MVEDIFAIGDTRVYVVDCREDFVVARQFAVQCSSCRSLRAQTSVTSFGLAVGLFASCERDQ